MKRNKVTRLWRFEWDHYVRSKHPWSRDCFFVVVQFESTLATVR